METLDAKDIPGLVRRVRRTADLSQRDLARVLGVSQSVIARWETGRRGPSALMLLTLLNLAALGLAVLAGPVPVAARDGEPTNEPTLDAPDGAAWGPANGVVPRPAPGDAWHEDASAGTPPDTPSETFGAALADVEPELIPLAELAMIASPMRDDGVRDRGNRRYPAHLDVRPVDHICPERWDRPNLRIHCPLRRGRDQRRASTGMVHADHWTLAQVLATLAAWRQERGERIRRLVRPRPEPEPCFCPIECEEGPCPDDCPCGCERPTWRWTGAA